MLAMLPFLHVGAPAGPSGLAQLVDGKGRTVLLRGVNVNGLEDQRNEHMPLDPAPYTDGACPADDTANQAVTFCERDLPRMKAMGFDIIRLALSWSALEPRPGQISASYLDRIAQVVGWARDAGIYVVLDMHQDGWSKFLAPGGNCPPPSSPAEGQDGAPEWATVVVTPMCAPGGTKELAPAVGEAFQRFYANADGLQDHFANAFVALAKRFHDDPTVAGYEILNEPHPGFAAAPGAMDATELFPFYAKVVDAVTAAIPGFRQLFFVEPNAMRNLTDQGPILTPWAAYSSYPNVVFAPHVYTHVFTADAEAGQRLFPDDGGYQTAVRDAKVLGLPLWIGEFGNDPSDDATTLAASYRDQDGNALGGAVWVWRENGRWGADQPSRLKYDVRIYPRFTAGTIDAMRYDEATRSFTLSASGAAAGQRTRIATPTGVSTVTATGASFKVRDGEVVVTPHAAAYSVKIQAP
jgi:endoglycosylceramidase